jgi:L-ascorbate metabolism protein UlaG (beta-lactamase superfamily)
MTHAKISPGLSVAAVFVLAMVGCAGGSGESSESSEESSASSALGIEIEYIAHASFLIRAEDGTELLIDPYASRVWLGYDWPDGIEPDAILITHPHYDHDAGRYRDMPFPWEDAIPVVDAPSEFSFGDFTVTGVKGKHADPYGMEFGQLNTLMIVEAHGLRIAHLGDNGPLTAEMVQGLGRVDVLMIPGDGVDHIISAETTEAILTELDPRVVIPMHYRLPDLEVSEDSPSDLGDIEPWLEGRAGVRRLSGNTTKLSSSGLPAEREYLVFAHAPYVVGPSG